MKERESIIVAGILSVLLFAWLGFLVHVSPRFAGSGVGAPCSCSCRSPILRLSAFPSSTLG